MSGGPNPKCSSKVRQTTEQGREAADQAARMAENTIDRSTS